MKRKLVAETLFELFNNRLDAYAIRSVINGKKVYAPHRNPEGHDLPFTVEVCEQHLKGEMSIGCYALDKEDLIKWVAVDFDGKRGNALEDAVKVKRSLDKLNLVSSLERSQGGNGVHLWLFFEEKLAAKIVRAVLGQHISEFDVPPEKRTTSYDRMFPNQDSAFGQYGNLCALPLNGSSLVTDGKTAFITDTGGNIKDQSLWLVENVHANSTTVILEEYKKLPPKRYKKELPVLQEVPGGMKLLAPQGCAWLRKAFKNGASLSEPEWYAALGQFGKVEQGEILAHKFSEAYPGYSYEETQRKFEHAKTEQAMSCQTIWDRFGDCGKRCGKLGVVQPWQLATVPLSKLDEENKGKIHDAKDIADTAKRIIDEVSAGKRLGFAWGYDYLDNVTELRPRNLIVVAARTGIGKTAVLTDASVRGAERGIPQYIFSIEMSYEELALRYLARLTGIDHTLISTGRLTDLERKAIDKALLHFKDLPIFIDDSTRDLNKMLDNVGELVYKNGTGVMWIDYLQLVKKDNKESKKDAVDRVVDGYKQIAKIIDIPVVTLAQFNRTEETTESNEDLDSWIKDSGDIEQTADVIHFIRGRKGPGIIDRRWRLHKERFRPSGINFRFVFDQKIFKMDCKGFWDSDQSTDYQVTNGTTTNGSEELSFNA